MSDALTNHQVRLAARPVGLPTRDNWRFTTEPVPELADGDVLVQTMALSLDPAMRGWMNEGKSYIPPVALGEVMRAGGVGRVVASRNPAFAVGDDVYAGLGVQTYCLIPAAGLKASGIARIDLSVGSATQWLNVLGMPGMTGYFGLMDIGQPKAGETVVVSGAAGAVGQTVGQLAKIHGCRVVGIAGTGEKCRAVVDDFGFDACVNYRAPDFKSQLAAALPGGCDIYFDNVGGNVSLAVSPHYNDFARVAICGLISQYSGQQPHEPTAFDEFLRLILTRRLTVRGFIIYDIAPNYPEFQTEMAKWLQSGRIVHRDHVHRGFDRIVPAFLGMLAGENTGKTIVDLRGE